MGLIIAEKTGKGPRWQEHAKGKSMRQVHEDFIKSKEPGYKKTPGKRTPDYMQGSSIGSPTKKGYANTERYKYGGKEKFRSSYTPNASKRSTSDGYMPGARVKKVIDAN